MEEQGLKLWRLFLQQPQLWPGWDMAATPIAFHDDQRAVLFGHPNPPKEFKEKEAEGVNYYVAYNKPDSFTANTSVDLNGVPTATIMWHQREEEAMLGLISHEAFHAYQMSKNCPLGNIAMAMKYPVNDAQVQVLAIIEAELLYRALSTDNLDFVAGALNARAARQALVVPEIAVFEDEVELGEGLATYIEVKSAGPGSKLWNAMVELLPKLNKNAWGADRLRFYYSGMAWALLCDEYAPGWQQKEWQPQANILAEAMGHTPMVHRRIFPGIDYDNLLLQQQQEAEKREEQTQLTLAQALPGNGVRIEIYSKGIPVGGGWNPNTAVTFPGTGRFHPTGLMYVYDTGVKVKVDKDCLEKEHIRWIVFERYDLTITIDGKRLVSGEHQGRLEISGEDCEIYLPQAKVKFDGKILKAEEIL